MLYSINISKLNMYFVFKRLLAELAMKLRLLTGTWKSISKQLKLPFTQLIVKQLISF